MALPSRKALNTILTIDVRETLTAPVAAEGITAKRVAQILGVENVARVERVLSKLVETGDAADITKPRQKIRRYQGITSGS